MKKLKDEKEDDEIARKELNETNSLHESLVKKKGNVKNLIDKYDSGQKKNEELNEELDNKQLEDKFKNLCG